MNDPHALVDHLFRHRAGQMVSTLVRILGAPNMSLAEDVVQEALVTALQKWRLGDTPENPSAWLFQVARNRALDHIRREATLRQKEPEIAAALRDIDVVDEPAYAHEVRDDQLRLMFLCCHPAIPEESRIALTLKTVGGFSVEEIARAYLTKKETIAQRLVRAKRLIRDEGIAVEFPSREEMPDRRETLLKALYLGFNEGYSASGGDDLIRTDICSEAVRLARLVVEHPIVTSPAAHALVALMLLQAARFPARENGYGELTLLENQDRSEWDPRLIAEGMRHLDCSAAGDSVTRYHLEAGIAATHAAAASFEETDWQQIAKLYDQLLTIEPSPVVELNRGVAVAMSEGVEAGIAVVESIAAHPTLRDYLPLATTLGELWMRSGDRQRAAAHFARALELPASLPEKRFLLQRLADCRCADAGSG